MRPTRREAEASVIGYLDAEDMARTLTGFRGQPRHRTPPMRYARTAADGNACVYAFDASTAMVYIVE